ncbi:MAG: hypothetical protein FRX48_08266 [Lasallia pustulata]|uniref:Uncharacterized protein n=1 Tax=Lasallia pustulata TaxID=136370 RepID=A0A5M8PFA7_9LECA|nr:MAG: hypothetical protein FRX48_08266 [Lasallia pustulata]
MTQRSSGVPLTAAGLFGRLRPYSGQTFATTASETSERGFQNLGGRKIESVLTSGGSGYGDPGPAGAKETLSGSSFYRDSQGFYGGPSHPVPTAGAAGVASGAAGPSGQGFVPTERDKEVAVMRPSPARTPVTLQSGFAMPSIPPGASTPPSTPLPPPPPRPRDVVGRSHPSLDGSRGSRFTEDVG